MYVLILYVLMVCTKILNNKLIILIGMGFNKRFKPWDHVDEIMAALILGDFEWWHNIIGLLWKRYVFADHVKAIAEKPNCDYWFLRSIFRSRQQIGLPGDMLGTVWVLGYVAVKNEDTGNFEIVNSTNTMTMQEYRELYRECGGSGNW